ncbi:hypothetical protein TH63_13080 [Rufibacter radiotolerans]|uniref:Uncharacterized protein n=1 Tax=Rufibacter radiotolerans TaxID=1379910 RepID=A0A0H4W7D6_9BACT|nr:hypothetical protein [Rufibacter radiotolerans]AKQ46346.1 hypothetical protein TH63_13080 [Rufibacter radiotolerans]
MKNTLFLILIAFLLFLAIFFYWKQSQAESELTMANDKITSLEQQVRRFTRNLPPDTVGPMQSTQPELKDSTAEEEEERIIPPASTQFEDELGSLSEADIARLKRQGLKNPEADLMNDLMRKQKTVLNATGSVGGTMAIRDVRILNDHYALAYFEDGHNGGHMVLRYTVKNGAITWTRLDSYTM